MIDHMDIESTCIHKDSEEAQIQLQMDSNATGLSFHIMNFWLIKLFYCLEKNAIFSSFVVFLYLGLKAAAQKTVRNTRKEKIVATFVDTSKIMI